VQKWREWESCCGCCCCSWWCCVEKWKGLKAGAGSLGGTSYESAHAAGMYKKKIGKLGMTVVGNRKLFAPQTGLVWARTPLPTISMGEQGAHAKDQHPSLYLFIPCTRNRSY